MSSVPQRKIYSDRKRQEILHQQQHFEGSAALRHVGNSTSLLTREKTFFCSTLLSLFPPTCTVQTLKRMWHSRARSLEVVQSFWRFLRQVQGNNRRTFITTCITHLLVQRICCLSCFYVIKNKIFLGNGQLVRQ